MGPFPKGHQKTTNNAGLFQLKEKCRDDLIAASSGWLDVLFAGSGSAEDSAEDVANAVPIIAPAVVAVVVVTTILPKSCSIALHKAISKLLRPGVLIVVGTLGVVALPAASITRPSAQPSLVPLVQINLSAVIVIAVVAITVITIVTIVIITACAILILVAIPSPMSILPIASIAIIALPLTVLSILRLSSSARHNYDSKH